MSSILMSLTFSLLLLPGCEDPVLEAARKTTEASSGGSAEEAEPPSEGNNNQRRSIMDDDATEGNPEDKVHKPGIPGEPKPGKVGSPNPGEPGEPGEGVPEDPKPGVPDEPPPENGDGRAPPPIEGPTVMVRGTIDLPDWYQGGIRIDVFDGDQLEFGGKAPGLVAKLSLDTPGAFEVEVPQSVKAVWLSAFNDEDMDGRPGPVDPTGYYQKNPVMVEDGDVAGVTITLKRRDPPGGKVDEGL